MSAALHIKDSYYFEVPKFMWRYHNQTKSDFPEVWVKNDPQFQQWEAERELSELEKLQSKFNFKLPPTQDLFKEYEGWVSHDHANFGKPLDVYLEEGRATLHKEYEAQVKTANKSAKEQAKPEQHFKDWLALPEQQAKPFLWYAQVSEDPAWRQSWNAAKDRAGNVAEFGRSDVVWSPEKINAYNDSLSGKIVLNFQPFGKLKNLYETESGFCISKFMVVEVAVGLILLWIFSSVARKIATGDAPKGKLQNLLEVFLLYIRDAVVRPSLGGHDHGDHSADAAHGHDVHGHDVHGHDVHGHDVHGHDVHGHDVHGHDVHGHDAHDSHHHAPTHVHAVHANPADAYAPLLWTIFFFILGCNLMGMIPWLGAPTGSFGMTFAMACVTLAASIGIGTYKFGVLGFWKNQVPTMDLPWVLALILKPMIFLIEVAGLFIKHAVLAVRLLANMVAGHLVLLAIMMLAFSVEGALSSFWPMTAVISVLGSTAFSCLELFVAFLQAYVFTFLSALFIMQRRISTRLTKVFEILFP